MLVLERTPKYYFMFESDCVNWTSSWMSGNENQDVHFNSKITTKPRAELIKDNN